MQVYPRRQGCPGESERLAAAGFGAVKPEEPALLQAAVVRGTRPSRRSTRCAIVVAPATALDLEGAPGREVRGLIGRAGRSQGTSL